MEVTTPFCTTCGGHHEPDPPSYMDFKGRRFRSPFHCLCCGKETCARQFAWGRTCGYCDSGQCVLGLVVKPVAKSKAKAE